MQTKRHQDNHQMSDHERSDFSRIIRTMPWLYTPILNALESLEGQSLCDIACGDGYLLELIQKQRPKLNLTGIDIDASFIEQAKNAYPFIFVQQDAYGLENTYDLITCNLALHHFEQPAKLITHLLTKTRSALILSDQLRPETEIELQLRLEKRAAMVKDIETDYYRENEKASILEAFSEKEIRELLSKFTNYQLTIYDNDYYKRFVAVFSIEN